MPHLSNRRHWGTARDIAEFHAAIDRAAYIQYARVQKEARRRLAAQREMQQLCLALGEEHESKRP